MNGVNKTLFIPLYGKAYVSKRGLFLDDKWAEKIWADEGFSLKGKSKSKWLAYYMGIRSAVFDSWVKESMQGDECVVLHIGCGLDSRVLRVGAANQPWYDVDFPEVIRERRRFFAETDNYRMIEGDARNPVWLDNIPEAKRATVVMEGVSMYLSTEELCGLTKALSGRFDKISLLMDCYTTMAAKMSKYRNPINDVGVTRVYGLDNPTIPESDRLRFIKEHEMTPKEYIDRLKGMEKQIFRKLYAGSFAKKLYRLFEYEKA